MGEEDMKILLYSMGPEIALMIKNFLESKGYVISECVNLNEFNLQFKTGGIDLGILWVPHAKATQKDLKNWHPENQCPVLYITCDPNGLFKEHERVDFPLNLAELSEKVDAALEKISR